MNSVQKRHMKLILIFTFFLSSCLTYQNKSKVTNNQNNQNLNNTTLDTISETQLINFSRIRGKTIYNANISYGDDGRLHIFAIAGTMATGAPPENGTISVFHFFSTDGGLNWQEAPALDDMPISFEISNASTHQTVCTLKIQDAFQLIPYIDKNGATLLALNQKLYVFWKDYTSAPDIIQPNYNNKNNIVYSYYCFDKAMNFKIHHMKFNDSGTIFTISDDFDGAGDYIPKIEFSHLVSLPVTMIEGCEQRQTFGNVERLYQDMPQAYMDDLPLPFRAVAARAPDGNLLVLARNHFPTFNPNTCRMDQNLLPAYYEYAPIWNITRYNMDGTWSAPKRIESDFFRDFRLTMQEQQMFQPPDPEPSIPWYWHQFALIDMQADPGGDIYLLGGFFQNRQRASDHSLFPMLFRIHYDPADEMSSTARMDLLAAFHESSIQFAQSRDGKIILSGKNHSYFYDPSSNKMSIARDICPTETEPGICGNILFDDKQALFVRYRQRMLPEMNAHITLSPAKGKVPLAVNISIEMNAGGETRDYEIDIYRNIFLETHETYSSSTHPDGITINFYEPGYHLVAAVVRPAGVDVSEQPFHAQLFYVHAYEATLEDSKSVLIKGIPWIMDEKYSYAIASPEQNGNFLKIFFYKKLEDTLQLSYVYDSHMLNNEDLYIRQARVLPSNEIAILSANRHGGELTFLDTTGDTPRVNRTFSFSSTNNIPECTTFDINDEILVCLQLGYVHFFDPVTFENLGIIDIAPAMEENINILANGYIILIHGGYLKIIDPGSLVSGHAGPVSYRSFLFTDDASLHEPITGISYDYKLLAIEGNRALFHRNYSSYKWLDLSDPNAPSISEEFDLVAENIEKCQYSGNKLWCTTVKEIILGGGFLPEKIKTIAVYDLNQSIEVFSPSLQQNILTKKQITKYQSHNFYENSSMLVHDPYIHASDLTSIPDSTDNIPYNRTRILKLLY